MQADLFRVATPEPSCPVCQADIPLAGDEKPGDEVICTYCGAPCRIAGKRDEDGRWELEEDF